jgi:hypothetical protein
MAGSNKRNGETEDSHARIGGLLRCFSAQDPLAFLRFSVSLVQSVLSGHPEQQKASTTDDEEPKNSGISSPVTRCPPLTLLVIGGLAPTLGAFVSSW